MGEACRKIRSYRRDATDSLGQPAGILRKAGGKGPKRRNLEAGFQGPRENTIKAIGNPIRGQITKGPIQGAKSGRLPPTEQIPGTEAAVLNSDIHRSRTEKPTARGNEDPTRITAIDEGFNTLEGRKPGP